jgi:hypothetical protein
LKDTIQQIKGQLELKDQKIDKLESQVKSLSEASKLKTPAPAPASADASNAHLKAMNASFMEKLNVLQDKLKKHQNGKEVRDKDNEITTLQIMMQNKDRLIQSMSKNHDYVHHLEGQISKLKKENKELASRST